jgi:hypothetical protein
MPIKLSFLGYTVCGIGLSMLIGFLSVASPISRYLVWLIGIVCVCCLALGLLNFAGLVTKGYGFTQRTLIVGILPGGIFAFLFLCLVAAGVSLGVR